MIGFLFCIGQIISAEVKMAAQPRREKQSYSICDFAEVEIYEL